MTRLHVALAIALLVAASSAGCSDVDGALAPWCDEVSPAGSRTAGLGTGATPDPDLVDGLEAYGWNQHRDAFAGLWIDQTRSGTIVVHFTDDPAPHREAAIHLGATAAPGQVVEVVQVARSQRELDETRAEVERAMGDPELGTSAVGTSVPANRVTIGLVRLSGDAERRKLAKQFGADVICVAPFEESYIVAGG